MLGLDATTSESSNSHLFNKLINLFSIVTVF